MVHRGSFDVAWALRGYGSTRDISLTVRFVQLQSLRTSAGKLAGQAMNESRRVVDGDPAASRSRKLPSFSQVADCESCHQEANKANSKSNLRSMTMMLHHRSPFSCLISAFGVLLRTLAPPDTQQLISRGRPVAGSAARIRPPPCICCVLADGHDLSERLQWHVLAPIPGTGLGDIPKQVASLTVCEKGGAGIGRGLSCVVQSASPTSALPVIRPL